ncbi:MAG TPA: hypothetical protein VFU63_06755 [Ktedonobacterales bacterium]|nr:hypothetical protein [Ktedonobacterales bacterium]
MALSLTEKGILLLHGVKPEVRSQSTSSGLATANEVSSSTGINAALLMDALLHGVILVKRAPLFVRCRACYFALGFGSVFWGLALILGPAVANGFGVLSFSAGVVMAFLGMTVYFVTLAILMVTLFEGRLATTEAPPYDEISAMALQKMREIGQGKTIRAYARRLFSASALKEQVIMMQKRLIEQGYLTLEVSSSGVWGDSRLVYHMNLDQPECQELRSRFRAFLLTGYAWDEEMAALAILVCPRLFSRWTHLGDWRQENWVASFAPAEYPVIEARLKAIRGLRDQTIRTQWGMSIYQGLLTIRYGFAM